MKNKINIPRPQPIRPNKLIITRRSLTLFIPDQHTHNTQRRALSTLHRAPALTRQQIETDNAVAVNVRVQRYIARRRGAAHKDDFWRLDRV